MKHRGEREFGLVVGGVLALLGGWWIYRHRFGDAAYVVLSIGALLVILGLVYPRILRLPRKAWMLLAEGLSFVTTRIILGIVFFLIVTPIGVIKRWSGWDPLNRRSAR